MAGPAGGAVCCRRAAHPPVFLPSVIAEAAQHLAYHSMPAGRSLDHSFPSTASAHPEIAPGALMARWWFRSPEDGGIPTERCAVGDCDCNLMHIGDEWHWLVRRDGHDLAEGVALDPAEARRQAEAVVKALISLVSTALIEVASVLIPAGEAVAELV